MRPKNNLRFIIIFGFVVVLFQWKLITMKSLFIGGDNLVQFYPWFKAYSECIKNLTFPFWERCMQSGFPLMAEGQVGGYYPINMISFLALPLNIAYNYAIVFHFIIAGASIYFLARRLGACEWGGTLSAIIFCFGSAYAGCFYNVISLRTLSWTPLVFMLFELFFEKNRWIHVAIAGVIFGMQLLAGFAQLAFYCWIFYAVYFLCRAGLRKTILYFLPFSAVAFIIFLPQFILTYKLVLRSLRPAADLAFALWGSFNPVYIIRAIFPYLYFISVGDFYLSVFGILFLITSFYLLKTEKRLIAVCLVFIFSLFLSLGAYNPFYVLILKLSGLYVFRNPSKFLFFAALAASVLIGRGFSEFMKNDFRRRNSALKVYSILLCSCAVVFLSIKVILVYFKGAVLKFGQAYVISSIFGKNIHRHSLDIYLRKVHEIYSIMAERTNLMNVFNMTSWLLLISALVISLLIIKKDNLKFSSYSRGFVVCVITIDLFVYSFIGTGFRGNMCSPGVLNPTHPGIFNYIKNDKDIFRVLPYGVNSGRLPSWIMPNANMVYKIDSIAGYTPLANKHYREMLSGLEIVDDSLGVTSPKEGSIDNNLLLLRLLNVKYVVSAEELDKPYLEPLLKEGGVYLYRLNNSLPRAFVLKKFDAGSVDSNIRVKVVEYSSGKGIFNVDMPYDGFLAFSENNLPGWKAYVDGEETAVRPLLLINTASLSKGRHVISFVYDPY